MDWSTEAFWGTRMKYFEINQTDGTNTLVQYMFIFEEILNRLISEKVIGINSFYIKASTST